MPEDNDIARIVVNVRSASGPDSFLEVEVVGKREGLLWLAEEILRIAHAEPERHAHLDAEACAPVYISPAGWWLTISRSERIRNRRKGNGRWRHPRWWHASCFDDQRHLSDNLATMIFKKSSVKGTN